MISALNTVVVPEEALVKRQLELEETYKIRGIERARKLITDALQNGGIMNLPMTQRMLTSAYEVAAAAIDEMRNVKAPGIGGKYRRFLRLIPLDVLTTLSLCTMFEAFSVAPGESASRRQTAQAVMSALGRNVQSELLALQLRNVAPAYMDRVYEYLTERRTKSPTHILRTLRASAENVHYGHEPWTNAQNISVGRLLCAAVFETGLFQWKTGSGNLSMLYPADDVMEAFQKLVESADTVTMKPPMLVPPVQHTTMWDGGYLTPIDNRGTYHNSHIDRARLREVAEALKSADGIKKALNKAQETPYRINKRILELVQEARALGIGIGMPRSIPEPKPEWYLDGVPKENYTEEELDRFGEWKTRMSLWYSADRKRVSQLRSLLTTLEMAEEFKDEKALYFPTCVDWRYRLYFKSSLHPQGSDLQKALLEFGRGKPLGERGLFWLKVHVATCFGYDKTLFEDRADWVDKNMAVVRSVAENPFDSDAFKQADSPWCFLAAVLDLVAALDSPCPEEYISRTPVAMDATNSGGQHLSALLRDPVGGRLTNLYWEGNDKKADLYMDVKRRTDEKVILDLDKEDFVIQSTYWRENEITRSMTKRPSMTYFYSATVRSCSDYIFEGACAEGYEGTDTNSLWNLSCYLAPRMRAAIEEANPAAAAVMGYLQNLARRVPASQHLQWYTPLGGLVMNRYTQREEVRVRIDCMNLSAVLVHNRDFKTCNKRKAASGIAPNFVHSLDSTHLMMVLCAAEGLDIVPIHDSLATHAADVDAMHRHIREQFVRLYEENDLLGDITRAAAAAGADLTDLDMPEVGTLDIRQVLESPFFFC
jgi:DNA-directed RNA polymerase